jgi:hypothetical protein
MTPISTEAILGLTDASQGTPSGCCQLHFDCEETEVQTGQLLVRGHPAGVEVGGFEPCPVLPPAAGLGLGWALSSLPPVPCPVFIKARLCREGGQGLGDLIACSRTILEV